MIAQATSPLHAIAGATYLSLTTYRKNGDPVATPVWFAEAGGRLYLFTFPGAGKLKRIRHTARVTFAPCKVGGQLTGPVGEATARIVTDASEQRLALAELARKYGLIWHLYHALMGLARVLRRSPKVEHIYVAIEPAR
jgi:PPOX class probable F420-dependent enzyme